MKKILLSLLMWGLLGGNAFAALAIDGSASNSGCSPGPIVTCAQALTTTQSNDIIIAWPTSIFSLGGAGPTSVSGAGLTWTKRKAQLLGNISIDLWYAIASSPLTAQTITATWGAPGVDAARMTVFGVSGGNTSVPFDPNVSLPAQSNANANTLSVTISTSNANDMLLSGMRNDTTGFGTLTRPASFTQILATGGVNDFAQRVVSSTQSSVTETFSWTNAAANTILIFDALQQAGSAAPSNLLLDSAF